MRGGFQAIEAARTQLQRHAAGDVPVPIEGATSTATEVAARGTHPARTRREFPLLPLNCGAIPGSLFENELGGNGCGAFAEAKVVQPG